jgi:hypothetical protein
MPESKRRSDDVNVYSGAVFLHVLAAVGLFVGFGLEWTALRQLQRSTNLEQVRTWLPVVRGSGRIAMPSMIVVLLSGFYMARIAWRGAPWIGVTLATLVLIIAIGVVITRPRMRAIAAAIAGESGNSASALRDPMLTLSLDVRAAMAVGILFLMTVKPEARESVLAIAVTTIAGIIAAVPLIRAQRGAGFEAGRPSY